MTAPNRKRLWRHISLSCSGEQHAAQATRSIFSEPTSGTIEWARIEVLPMAAGCHRMQGSESSVMFEKDGVRAYFHRPHPRKEALRYRVRDARAFLLRIEVKP